MSDPDTDPDTGQQARRRGITLFSGKDATGLFESGTMSYPELDADDQQAIRAEGRTNRNIPFGDMDQVIFRGEGENGFSLIRAWFGPHYVLPRHSHDGDCLYYVVEGCLTMGAKSLETGDGFFVPEGAPYSYVAGPEGVVVLEFRSRTSFGMKVPGGQLDMLRRLVDAADEHGETWKAMHAARFGS
jgi:quercetin dioxygenase-like cupin family protein